MKNVNVVAGKSTTYTKSDCGVMICAYSRFCLWEVTEIEALVTDKKVYDVEDIQ